MGSMANSYIRFLNLSDSLVANSGSTKLDATEEQLLRVVMIAHSQGSETLVGDLLVLSHIGSQATLHGRVHNLIAAGLGLRCTFGLVVAFCCVNRYIIRLSAADRDSSWHDILSSCSNVSLGNFIDTVVVLLVVFIMLSLFNVLMFS